MPILAVVLFLQTAAFVFAQQATPTPAAATDVAAMMAAMDEFTGPKEQHKILNDLVGTWNCAAGVDGAPEWMRGTGPGEAKWVLGGRFVEMRSKVTSTAGNFVESITFYGFDVNRQKYSVLGMDTLGTYWVEAYGDYNAATKTLELKGSLNAADPTGAMKTMSFTWTVAIESANKHTLTIMGDFGDGNKMPMGKVVCTK